MASLHIEHPVTDLATWVEAFNRFADIRAGAGVTAERVLRPPDDDRYVVIDLDFETVEQAEAFLGFLRTQVWTTPELSPALDGQPEAQVLADVEV